MFWFVVTLGLAAWVFLFVDTGSPDPEEAYYSDADGWGW